MNQLQSRSGRLAQFLAVLSVLLVLFSSAVQATHVHPDSGRHDCSLCSVAQAGTLITPAFHPTPSLLPSRIELQEELLVGSRQSAPSHFIRPPPSV